MSVERVLVPLDDDLDTGGFFAAARRGELALRRCDECGEFLHVPRQYCRHCGSWEGSWVPVDGAATLHSWTTVAHQVHPAYPVPYTVILVDVTATGTRLVGRLLGEPPALAAGMPLELWFEDLGIRDGRSAVVPNWRPV